MEVCTDPSVRKISLPHLAGLDFHSKTTWGKGVSVCASASTCKGCWQISAGQEKVEVTWE